MVSVQLLRPRDREIRLGLQGSTDELLANLTSASDFSESTALPTGRLFYLKGSTGQVFVSGGQVAIGGEGSDREAAAEAFYTAINSRPTNEATFVVS